MHHQENVQAELDQHTLDTEVSTRKNHLRLPIFALAPLFFTTHTTMLTLKEEKRIWTHGRQSLLLRLVIGTLPIRLRGVPAPTFAT